MVLAPMPSELRPIVRAFGLRRSGEQPGYRGALAGGDQVTAALIGVGPAAAAAATARLLDQDPEAHVVVCGVAGGIDPEVAVGTMVVPEVVLDLSTGVERRPSPLGNAGASGTMATTADFITADHDLRSLRSRGVVAVDMESAAVGAVCEQRGVGWTVFRCISDRPHDGLVDDAVFTLLRPDGSVDALAALRLALARPRRIPDLVRLGRDTGRAAGRAARMAARACEAASASG
jgi:adenosylhomocysteine nucleosidase